MKPETFFRWFLAVLVACVLAIIAARATAAEALLGTGTSQWSACGTNGCWRQPPLPYSFDLRTGTWHAGVRIGSAELVYHGFGQTRVSGDFVNDADYDSGTREIAPGARVVPTVATQRTRAVTLSYAPRWALGRGISAQPSIGVERHFTQIHVSSAGWGVTLNEKGWTGVAGIRLLKDVGDGWSVGVGAEWYLRPRTVNSLAGGGADHPIGLRSQFLEVRKSF